MNWVGLGGWVVMQEWRCNGKGYVAYRNFLLRRIDGGAASSCASTPSNRCVLILFRFFFLPHLVALPLPNETRTKKM